MNDAGFECRYPDALGVHEKLLAALCAAGIGATWFVVGGMNLRGSGGARDRRMAGLPGVWVAGIPCGSESNMPLWYRPSFVERLRAAAPAQEIGLHGGLTHLIWTDPRATRAAVEWELSEGLKALERSGIRALTFSFGREQEAHHDLLRQYGIRSYRGRTVTLAHRLGTTLPGAMLRAWNELTRATPPPVWPLEAHPGLWNIPSSLFLYPIGRSRSRIVGLRSRVERFTRGVEAAARYRGIFHFCLHPENLAESRGGCSLFEEMLDRLSRARARGDVEVLTMGEVAGRMDRGRDATASRAGVSTAASEPTRCPDPSSNERSLTE
jgi:peptidoglycan/xylan/chitin deacetylase (PgdA/CDA1 family)